jgi:hypothetical protein
MERLIGGALPPLPHTFSWFDAFAYNKYLEHARVLIVSMLSKLLAMVVKVFAVFNANSMFKRFHNFITQRFCATKFENN